MASIVHRNRLHLLEVLPKNGLVAELGVFRGQLSQEILARAQPRRLYLVDTFDGLVFAGDANGENICVVDMTKMRLNLELKFGGKPVTVVRSDSVRWMEEQAPFSIDWVYIDTTHGYKQTISELIAAKQCVKPEGFICGHDYIDECREAVTSFARRSACRLRYSMETKSRLIG